MPEETLAGVTQDTVEAPGGLYTGGRDYAAPIDAAGAWRVGEPQVLRLVLDGITAGDYLCWVRDPEPHALGRELRSISVSADPLDDQIDLELRWDHDPPDPRSAAIAAGFQLAPGVVGVLGHYRHP
jgi:hypothetical protein